MFQIRNTRWTKTLPILTKMKAIYQHSVWKSTGTVKPEDITWSTGEKQKPVSKKYNPEEWYRVPPKLLLSQSFDPKDPSHRYPYKRADGGIQYFKFVYYPRFPDKDDPPVKPSPLFMVRRTKRLKGRPYWEKDIMEKLGLCKKLYNQMNSNIAIVKNIPEINALLWQVKHLVEILPVKLPENVPEDANPLHFFLTEEGEIKYNPEVKYVEKDLEEESSIKKMNYLWIDEQTRKIYWESLDYEF